MSPRSEIDAHLAALGLAVVCDCPQPGERWGDDRMTAILGSKREQAARLVLRMGLQLALDAQCDPMNPEAADARSA